MSKASTYQRRARDFAQRENWDGALAELRQAVSADANNPMLHNQMGDLFLRKEDVPQACTHFEKAIDLYSDLGLHNNAVALCRKVIRLCPSRLEVRFRLARLRVDQELLSEACASFADYLEHAPAQSEADVQALEERCREIVESFPEAAPIAKVLEKLEEARAFATAFEIVQRLAQRAADAGDDETARRYTTKMRSLQVLVEGRGGDLPGKPSAPARAKAATSRELRHSSVQPRPSWVDPSNVAMPARTEASAQQEAEPIPEIDMEAAPVPELAAADAPAPVAAAPEVESEADTPRLPVSEDEEGASSASVPEYDLDAETPEVTLPDDDPGPETAGEAAPEYDLDALPEASVAEYDLGEAAPEASVPEYDLDAAASPPEPDVPAVTSEAEPEFDLGSATETWAPEFDLDAATPEVSEAEAAAEVAGPHSRADDAPPSREYELHEGSLAEIAAFWDTERAETRVHSTRGPSRPAAVPGLGDVEDRHELPASRGPDRLDPGNATGWQQEDDAADSPPAPPAGASVRAAPPPSLRETVWVPDPNCTDPAIAEPREGGSVHELADVIDTFRKQMAMALGDDAAARYDLGVAYYEMGLYDEALDEFDVARTSRALRERSLEMMAACMAMQGRHAEILTLLAPVLQTQDDPSLDLGLRYCMGVACEALGRRGEARQHFEAVARVDSSYRDVRMRLQRF